MLESLDLYLGVIIGTIAVILLLVILASGYVESPPDAALIISDFRGKTIIGKVGIKISFLERLDELSLKLTPIDVKTSTAMLTMDYINIQVDMAINVKVSSDPGRLAMAAENFLDQNVEYIGHVAREVLEDNMRETVERTKLKEMVSDRQKFAELMEKNAMSDLAAMGLDTISFNVQNFSDNNGIIDNSGAGNTSQIRKKTAITKAEIDREVVVVKAKAGRQANDAKVNSDHEVAIKSNELDIQETELKKNADMKQVEAGTAYQTQEEQQGKAIEITTTEANTVKQEKEIIIKQRVAKVTEKALDAEVRKRAEADKYAHQQKAEAEFYEYQKNAETKKFEVQQEVEAQKLRAGVERLTREQEARGIRMAGDAEAEVIRVKGIAEAEAMRKKAEVYQKYTGVAVAGMMIKVLPEAADKTAELLVQIDKITIIGGGSDNSGVDNVAGNVTTVMAKLFESMEETTGTDPGEIVKANTCDAKMNRNIHVTGVSEGGVIGGEIVKNTIGDSAQ